MGYLNEKAECFTRILASNGVPPMQCESARAVFFIGAQALIAAVCETMGMEDAEAKEFLDGCKDDIDTARIEAIERVSEGGGGGFVVFEVRL